MMLRFVIINIRFATLTRRTAHMFLKCVRVGGESISTANTFMYGAPYYPAHSTLKTYADQETCGRNKTNLIQILLARIVIYSEIYLRAHAKL